MRLAPAPFCAGGAVTSLQPGENIEVLIRNIPGIPALHAKPAVVLAIQDSVALVEYTAYDVDALCFVSCTRKSGPYAPCWRNAYGYKALPKFWLRAIIDAGVGWSGRSKSGQVPTPAEILALK